MPKISVIVPCLNMQDYISACLRSIMRQTLSELEILVVDAGSTDGTLDVLMDLAREDGRVRIIHSCQKSYGYQVNMGIARAMGEYTAIVDADDKIASNMYEVLYENAVSLELDYAKGTAKSFYTISGDRTYCFPLMQFPKKDYIQGKIYLSPADRSDLLTRDNFLWYGIFKKDFIKHIRLHESPGAAFQDLGGLLQTQMNARKALYLNEPFYWYRQDNAEASNYNTRGFEFVWNEYTWAEQFVANASDKWREQFYRKFFLHTVDRYYAMGVSGKIWDGAEKYIILIRDKIKTALEENKIREESFAEGERENLQIFLTDEYGLYHQCLDMYAEKKNQLSSVLEKAKNRETVIFGSGQFGTFLQAQILKHNMSDIAAYCDNAADTPRPGIWNVPVLKPWEAVRLYPNACYIVANKNHSDEMRRQLIEMGISDRQICCYTEGVDMHLFGENFMR